MISVGAALLFFVGVAIGTSAGKTKKVAEPGPTVTATATTTETATVTATPIVRKVIATHTQTITHTYTPAPKHQFSDGTYQVGRDIPAGQYRTANTDGSDCYWEVLKSLSGDELDNVVNNDNFNGSAIVQVSTGQYLKVDGGCEWQQS